MQYQNLNTQQNIRQGKCNIEVKIEQWLIFLINRAIHKLNNAYISL